MNATVTNVVRNVNVNGTTFDMITYRTEVGEESERPCNARDNGLIEIGDTITMREVKFHGRKIVTIVRDYV